MKELLLIVASSMNTLGTIIIAIVVLRVHMHILKERKIDEDVVFVMKKERAFIIIGLALILMAYLIEISFLLPNI